MKPVIFVNLQMSVRITFCSISVRCVRVDHMHYSTAFYVSIVAITLQIGIDAISIILCAVWHPFHVPPISVNFKLVHPKEQKLSHSYFCANHIRGISLPTIPYNPTYGVSSFLYRQRQIFRLPLK